MAKAQQAIGLKADYSENMKLVHNNGLGQFYFKMKLTKLVNSIPRSCFRDFEYATDPDIEGISFDSRQIVKGDLFFAIPGKVYDGHMYVHDAINDGAIAIVAEEPVLSIQPEVPIILVYDGRIALAEFASAFYEFPSRELSVIGITGTDGKTTTARLVHSILAADCRDVGLITTLGIEAQKTTIDTGTHVTTPNAVKMQEFLREIVNNGMSHAVIEVTSHALEQNRVHAVDFDVAAITNVSREHLDFHDSMDSYIDAKAKLFRYVSKQVIPKTDIPRTSVLNIDDITYDQFSRIDVDNVLSYGINSSADFHASNINVSSSGTSFILNSPVGYYHIRTQLLGVHNVYNSLAAAAVCFSQGVDIDKIVHGLELVRVVHARMERVDEGQDFDVFVDFAHTPNALRNILQTARSIASNNVIVVFGLSGGLRDKGKRPLMGQVAGRLADQVVITAVDWYEDEHCQTILEQIAEGCLQVNRLPGKDLYLVPDRLQGIEKGISLAQTGDVVVIAGKGHEGMLSIGGIEIPWDEFGNVKMVLNQVM